MSRSGPAVSPARRLALTALVEISESDARIEAVLDRLNQEANLDRRDRALAAELTYGVCRWRARLDFHLATLSKRPLGKINPTVLNLLRLGLYQLKMLDRVPNHAALFETVELAKSGPEKRAAGFINGILRAAQRGPAEPDWPDREADLAGYLAATAGFPRWLANTWLKELGPAETEALLAALNLRPELTVRTPPGTRPAVLERLTGAGLEARPGKYSPQAVVIPGASLADLAGLGPEPLAAQSEAAQLVGLAVDPKPGWRVLDMCAGAGGKTGHLAQLLAGEGKVTAIDPDRGRLAAAHKLIGPDAPTEISFHRADATQPLPGELETTYDAVLIDAPCTGLGTLAARPDKKWRVGPNDPARLAKLQSRLLKAGAGRVRPGGVLVYAVCTLTEAETTDVLEGFLANRPDFKPDSLAGVLPGPAAELADRTGYVVTWPHRHHLEGFFIARLVKTTAGPGEDK